MGEFMSSLKRRGLSSAVTMVISIALGLALAISLSTIITKPAVTLAPKVACTQYAIESPLSITSACYRGSTGKVELTIDKPLTTQKIADLKFSFLTDAGEVIARCNSGCGCTVPDNGQTKKYQFSLDKPESLTLSVDSCPIANIQLPDC